ncbi:hypothetical protein TRIP_D440357 [uncultured Paludibacter sp.]|uniref:Uncharacterized protein n=1 Tax=uncultured Paludibacter sp. TaxID=497635 RepID=A0A653AJV8_9BACT|nr:hypothetical protein TRIP_D440357 [uncultured Paludibacter sp.]
MKIISGFIIELGNRSQKFGVWSLKIKDGSLMFLMIIIIKKVN